MDRVRHRDHTTQKTETNGYDWLLKRQEGYHNNWLHQLKDFNDGGDVL